MLEVKVGWQTKTWVQYSAVPCAVQCHVQCSAVPCAVLWCAVHACVRVRTSESCRESCVMMDAATGSKIARSASEPTAITPCNTQHTQHPTANSQQPSTQAGKQAGGTRQASDQASFLSTQCYFHNVLACLCVVRSFVRSFVLCVPSEGRGHTALLGWWRRPTRNCAQPHAVATRGKHSTTKLQVTIDK